MGVIVLGKVTRKSVLLGLIDLCLINLSLYGALWLRFEGAIPRESLTLWLPYFILASIIRLVFFAVFGLYNRLWRYASIGELVSIFGAVVLGTITIGGLGYLFDMTRPLPLSILFLDLLLSTFFIGGSRIGWRLIQERQVSFKRSRLGKPILIYGAGDAGVLVAKEYRNHYGHEVHIVGFIDDDIEKQKLRVLGIPVLGDRSSLARIVKKFDVKEVVIAMPSVAGRVIRDIVDICQKHRIKTKILPGMYDLIEGNVTVSKIREVDVEDLLSREPVRLDIEGISGYLRDNVVMVTGGGGSIGSELCRQIAKYEPRELLIFDVCENNTYEIELELRSSFPNLKLFPYVKSVQDWQAVEQIFAKHRPKVVFHAAAHKHVPLMEVNPEEAVKNNVLGTYNVARAASKYDAERFVLISTDKAVNPTSVMGATKRVAEMVIQYFNTISDTKYVAVRFGNVLGSRGSVIPLFRKQIKEGGPVTVTHRDMIRYFMTIPEAVQLVIQAGALAEGGELFILDMGEQVRIWELAETLIRLSGLVPGEDIEIIETGPRDGEKLYEEILTEEEGITSTKHERIFVARPTLHHALVLEQVFKDFAQGNLPRNQEETVVFLNKFLPEFKIVRHTGQASGLEEVAIASEG